MNGWDRSNYSSRRTNKRQDFFPFSSDFFLFTVLALFNIGNLRNPRYFVKIDCDSLWITREVRIHYPSPIFHLFTPIYAGYVCALVSDLLLGFFLCQSMDPILDNDASNPKTSFRKLPNDPSGRSYRRHSPSRCMDSSSSSSDGMSCCR